MGKLQICESEQLEIPTMKNSAKEENSAWWILSFQNFKSTNIQKQMVRENIIFYFYANQSDV